MAMGLHKARRRNILKSGALVLAGAMGVSRLGNETVGHAAMADEAGSASFYPVWSAVADVLCGPQAWDGAHQG